MKKIVKFIAIAVVGFGFVACSSDDDATPVNPMEGTWVAKTISYDAGAHSGTYPFDHEIFKKGCATDYLTLTADQKASLKENNKNEADVCVDQISNGTWTTAKVTINGVDRAVKSSSATELVLVYPINFMGQTLDVDVLYTK